uniref:28S ribosomal protein S15, mitochondrial-like n=1 Tax=Styela clava TaxID=7725 RepID=UPI0019392C69|nr:28S ribosomal protein S15, mitochondrial-like [Styela clava]
MLQSLRVTVTNQIPLTILKVTTNSCISCRTRRSAKLVNNDIPEERRRISQLDDLDETMLRPQYRHIEALKTAPENVRKIFTLEFGTKEEKLESKFLQYGEQLQRHKYDFDSLEMEIAGLTITIRKDQEEYVKREYLSGYLEKKLQKKRKLRNDLLLKLRQMNFERYCLVVKVLDINLIHWPDYDVKLTKRAEETMDMKFRTFAEIEREKHESAKRRDEVAQLQAKFEEKIKSGELVIP